MSADNRLSPLNLGIALISKGTFVIRIVHKTVTTIYALCCLIIGVFCSPEPLGSQGELIVYPSSILAYIR